MLNKITVLAVDDIDLNLRIIQDVLKELDAIEILEARNGKEALGCLAQRSDVDIVLLDLEMPVMNGHETLRYLKSHERFRDIPVIVVTSKKSEVKKILEMGANDFMAKPFDSGELKLRVMNHVRSKKLSDLTRDMTGVLESEIVRKTAALQKALSFSREAEFEISLRLGRAAEYRDLETGMHIRRISEMSKELAVLRGLPAEECEIIRHASPLHDVGKIGIPDRILLKPGKLDAEEFQLMQRHAAIGGRILDNGEKFPVIRAGKIIALQHHERWDGKGYPHGLSGTDIHIYGRVVMVADIFDALTSERPYKKPFPLEKAFEIMRGDREIFFDPELLDLFLDNRAEFVRIKEELREPIAQDGRPDHDDKLLFAECLAG
ncbi:MAG: response regulator [Deltaproteobacteria bacterium]|nr:response regulator [Deltaproteobacteria bacterium]TLN01187.1 MAG: response regulator [bacterium]